MNAVTQNPPCYFNTQCNIFATPPGCAASRPCGGFETQPCGVVSYLCRGFDTGDTCYYGSAVQCLLPPDGTRSRLFYPEQLPLLRRHLEEQLEQIETEQRRATERVEAQLKEIEAAEAALADHDASAGGEE